jgi:hypothetical protein
VWHGVTLLSERRDAALTTIDNAEAPAIDRLRCATLTSQARTPRLACLAKGALRLDSASTRSGSISRVSRYHVTYDNGSGDIELTSAAGNASGRAQVMTRQTLGMVTRAQPWQHAGRNARLSPQTARNRAFLSMGLFGIAEVEPVGATALNETRAKLFSACRISTAHRALGETMRENFGPW